MTLLGNTEFKCTKCEKPFKYSNAKEHYIKDCEATKLKPQCILCKEAKFENIEELIKHWKDVC